MANISVTNIRTLLWHHIAETVVGGTLPFARYWAFAFLQHHSHFAASGQNWLLFYWRLGNTIPSATTTFCLCRSTYEDCARVPLVTWKDRNYEPALYFQEAYTLLFSICYTKQGIQWKWRCKIPMNQSTTLCGSIFLKVFNQSGELVVDWLHFRPLCSIFDWNVLRG